MYVYYYIKSHNSFYKISIVALFFLLSIRAKIIRKYDKTFSALHINFKTNNHIGSMGMVLKRAINFDRDPSMVQNNLSEWHLNLKCSFYISYIRYHIRYARPLELHFCQAGSSTASRKSVHDICMRDRR